MEVKVRFPCTTCGGSGKVMTKEQAIEASRKHNIEASKMNLGGNYISPGDFMKCNVCDGTGYEEGWEELGDLLYD